VKSWAERKAEDTDDIFHSILLSLGHFSAHGPRRENPNLKFQIPNKLQSI